MSCTIFAAKKLLRKQLKDTLRQMTEADKANESSIVAGKVLGSEKYSSCQNVCVYVSMPEEVCTRAIITSILETKKSLFVPYFNKEEMVMVKIKDLEDYKSLPVDTYGVRQPTDYKVREHAISTSGLDLILCPGLGFTKEGLRIGRGKGYYDNYLTKYESRWGSQPYTIALAYSVQMLEHVPTTDSDRTLDEVISV